MTETKLLLGPDLLKEEAEKALDAGEAGVTILQSLMVVLLLERHESELVSALQAAILVTTDSRVLARTLLHELDFARRHA